MSTSGSTIGDESGFLAQRGVASQCLRVGLDAASAGNAIADGNHGAPLGKTGTHLRIFRQTVAQSVQTFGDFLSGMTGHVLSASIQLDARNDPRIGEDFEEGSAIFFLLADRLVVEDRATNALTETGRGHNQFPIGAPERFGLRNPQRGKSFVAGGGTFIHRQQPLVASDQRLRGVDQRLRIHLGLTPLPVTDFGHVFAMLVNVMLVLDELVLHLLLQVVALRTQIRHAINHVLHQMKAIQIVLHPHVEGRCDRAFFLVAPDVQVLVGAAVGQPVNQRRVAMKAKDDVLVFGEK